MTRPVPSDDWPVSRGAKRQIVSVSGNFRADTMEALYQAVMSGRGIARLPTYVVGPDVRSGALVALFSAADRAGSPAAEPGIWMTGYYLKSRYPDLKTLAFIEFLKMRFDARYDWERRDERWLAGAQGGD
jgi:DNA-binding transcriptional LysR family regulator